MSRHVIHKTPQAKQDLLELAQYIAKDSLDSALALLDAADTDMKRLAEMPGLGMRREFANALLAEVRSWPIRGFPNHLIFYRPISKGIEVIRVLHGARDIDAVFNA